MKQIEQISVWEATRKQIPSEKTVGVVTTMGALHAGHFSLIEQARRENDIVVLTIFVNPTQFNDNHDYQNYPNTLEQDKHAAEKLGVDFLLTPDVSQMYPKDYIFSIQPNIPIATLFEGEARPGHFAGMLTVVMKLLQLTRATRAYFGEKDYQQAILVTEMTKYFFMPTEIVICPILREKSGLPLSSRNSRLTEDEKQLAETAYGFIQNITLQTLPKIKEQLTQLGVIVEYLKHYENRIFLSIRIGKIRLIDNFNLKLEKALC